MISEAYYIKDDLEGFTSEEIAELSSDLQKAGFQFYAPQLGGGGDGVKIVEQIIASLNFHNFWFDIFVGVLANRLDKALSIIYSWMSKHESKKKENPVIQIFIYTPLRGKNNCYYIRFKADKKYSKNEIVQYLKKMKKEQK